jgi:hypothetical protein
MIQLLINSAARSSDVQHFWHWGGRWKMTGITEPLLPSCTAHWPSAWRSLVRSCAEGELGSVSMSTRRSQRPSDPPR